MQRRPPSRPRLTAYALMLCLASRVALADEQAGRPASGAGCGTKALYLLARLEGRSIDLDQLGRALGEPTRHEHSLKELRDVAARYGLRLSGARRLGGRETPDRPAIVLLNHEPHGHFVVIRPVGHTGKLLQVLDPNDEPEVIDAIVLYGSGAWTGLALMPERPNRPARIAAALLAVALMLVAPTALRRLTGRLAR